MKQSKIIVKVLLPVVLMGAIGILASLVGLVGINTNQAASEVISGRGIDNIVALKEMDANMQEVMKNIFGYSVAGSNNKDLQEERLTDLQKHLNGMDELVQVSQNLKAETQNFVAV